MYIYGRKLSCALSRRFIILMALALLPCANVMAQLARLVDTLAIHTEASGVVSDGRFAPYWMSNNRYGLSSIDNNWLLLRHSLTRDIRSDIGRKWQLGYGVDVAYLLDADSRFVMQQLYLDVQYKHLRLSLGQKERSLGMQNPLLSSGDMAMGFNARPIPQVRLELPDFIVIPSTKDWLAFKAHIAYGVYTDNSWQRHFVVRSNPYCRNTLYHSKAILLRVGNRERIPFTFTMGADFNTQFSGTAFNLKVRPDDDTERFKGGTLHIPYDIHAFWNTLVFGGSDATDAQYSNVAGNTVGSWHFSLDYYGNGWKGRAYMQHLFEDHSQLFWQYGWQDMLFGVELAMPDNPVVNGVVYEYVTSKDQSGPIYHDRTPTIPDQISAIDNYYNHAIYSAWHHAGFGLGNALFISPIYNSNARIAFMHNRILAHHLGLSGKPFSQFGYRLLGSYERSWGTYSSPLIDPQEGWSLFVEGSYSPKWLRDFTFSLGYGHNGGPLLGNSNGMQLRVAWDRVCYGKRH